MSKMSMHETIHRAKIAFEMAGLKAPNLIVLADNRDGVRLMSEMDSLSLHPRRTVARVPVIEPMPARNFFTENAEPHVTATVSSLSLPHAGHLVEDEEGRRLMEVSVLGIRVRWPTKSLAIPGGSQVWY